MECQNDLFTEETFCSQNSNLYLRVFHFFNTSKNQTSLASNPQFFHRKPKLRHLWQFQMVIFLHRCHNTIRPLFFFEFHGQNELKLFKEDNPVSRNLVENQLTDTMFDRLKVCATQRCLHILANNRLVDQPYLNIVCRPNTCQPNGCRSNGCRSNTCRPNGCRPNASPPNGRTKNAFLRYSAISFPGTSVARKLLKHKL